MEDIAIGIDTGGTYTDAVAFERQSRRVVAKGKSRTTKEDLSIGICGALDLIPKELLIGARMVALSTTLATNACVEGKGARAKLVLIGTNRRVLESIGLKESYGVSPDDVLCLPSAGSFDGSRVEMPDWDAVIAQHEAWIAEAQAMAIVEANAARNGAVVERAGAEALRNRFGFSVIMGCEVAGKLNMMERGATALLNARLLPVIEEFMDAMSCALAARGVAAPVMIVRSDGCLMAEPYARARPVQTILSGPAASIRGSAVLADVEDCLVVDIGGTTTDLALIRGGVPVVTDGIRIGAWRTQVEGALVHTFGLGGDTRFLVRDGKLALDERRVEPLCAACERWPSLLGHLRELDSRVRRPQGQPFEVLYLAREPQDPSRYTSEERALIDLLREGPRMVSEASRVPTLKASSERLESEGVLMRAGLTPTDFMHISGDFLRYDPAPAHIAARCLAAQIDSCRASDDAVKRLCQEAYDLVGYTIYEGIVLMLAEQRYPHAFANGVDEQLREVFREDWRLAGMGANAGADGAARAGAGVAGRGAGATAGDAEVFDLSPRTGLALVGVGAPTGHFLPEVAKRLGARCVIPQHAEVANAVGAIASGVSATSTVVVAPVRTAAGVEGYVVRHEGGQELMPDRKEAMALASHIAREQACDEARRRGAIGELACTCSEELRDATAAGGVVVEMDASVTATASESGFLS